MKIREVTEQQINAALSDLEKKIETKDGFEQVNSDWDSSSGVSQILNKPSLAKVATSGSYNDLSDKPIIPGEAPVISVNGMDGAVVLTALDVNALPVNTHIPVDPVQSDWSQTNTAQLDYIRNKPTIPTKTSDLTNDSGFTTTTDINNAINALDVPAVGGTGKYIESISETDGKISATEKTLSSLMLEIYPVGSIYWTGKAPNDGGDPNVLFGGTWVQIKDKFILAAGDDYTNGSTGGSATVTLSEANLPSHKHTGTTDNGGVDHYHGFSGTTGGDYPDHTHNSTGVIESYPAWSGAWVAGNVGGTVTSSGASTRHQHDFSGTTGWSTSYLHTHSFTTGATGSGTAHDNMPPYIVKYCWERTA